MKIRSITLFATVDPGIDPSATSPLGEFAQVARQAYQEAGFEVQTIRLAADAFPALAQSKSANRPADWAAALERTCAAQGFDYVSLGPAPKEMHSHLPAILAATEFVFVTIQLVDRSSGAIDAEAIRCAARTICAASQIDDGFANLRFAALANVSPGTPFFPAAYGDGRGPAFAIATESADLAVQACAEARDAADAGQRLSEAIETLGGRLADVGERLAASHAHRFEGIDFSLAPYPGLETSIGAALEALTGRPVGAAGTLAAAAVLTDAIDRARFPKTGFCGLMLPVLEDVVLAQRAAQGRLCVGELLQWSAACGTGLDTVPLPGDASEEALARLLYDVAALSCRLDKPLTARLMPLPGKAAGDPVHFAFPYFADGAVLSLDEEGEGGLLAGADRLALRPTRRANERAQ